MTKRWPGHPRATFEARNSVNVSIRSEKMIRLRTKRRK